MQLNFSADAHLDIGEIYSYISRDSSDIAQKFISKLIAYIYHLSIFPEMGTKIKPYNIRKLVYRN